MPKTHLYFVPGLAANTKIFERISLPEEHFELHFLDWMLPTSIDESIEEYAERLCAKIQHKNPILIGVSFGGIIVQEMSKIIDCKKIIIISSVKNNKEFPKRFKLVQVTKAYKLFPSKVISNIESYERYFFNDYLKKRAELYKIYLSIRDKKYLQWAIYNVLHWKQEKSIPGIVHIHGKKDEVFPIKYIKNAIEVENGTHVMILTKSKTISEILKKECFLMD
ncbi:Pimeloyl-ACP methyl ester carboxylesterase [Tenacibaculum mesophilum]|uniref:Alpha/beta hydrolase n=1 Tax=Tenacibaculum mesophilum TaxID=104268 RepID=A0ABN5T4K1_9FLAO|nr:alpha/beta hydrolase [Tenacibaculum mesophilum]AZJ32207.1 alpha/beta hydrolase [Tenacibaculum mesophilum]QFS27463.1 alpha/beta hydrolase [Tenacibaculum mesophilum]SHG17592.1 Pimeloyl-ACP methyl ester carboxylesterase [Tenacibaculum mesophilum]